MAVVAERAGAEGTGLEREFTASVSRGIGIGGRC